MIGRKKVPGPLARLADGFRAELDRLGYTPSSREFKLAEVAKLSAWLDRSSPRATGPEGSNMPVSSGLVPATIQNVVM